MRSTESPPPARGAVTGLMFMVSKSIEYFQKFAHGITPGTNPFYMWYFTLTGIHLIHVVAGTSMLTYLWVRSRAVPTTTCTRPCRKVSRRTGTSSTCCGSCSSPCSTY